MTRALRSAGLPVETWIFGEGSDRAALQAEIEAAGLDGGVRLAGNRRPIHPYLQCLDLFVLPSHWEGQSLALLQAIACKIPVLASAIEGNLAVLGPAHPGLFAPDDAGGYARLARLAAESAEFRHRLLAAQKTIALPYASEVASRLLRIYSRILSSRS